MMMFYRRRASPKLRDDMTEVEYGGGGHRTRLRDLKDQLLCLWGAPLPPYIKEQGGGRPALVGAPGGVLLLLVGVGLPLLGNIVISKNFLRTRKIMVMHSNERGECCPRTLVDRKRKR